MPKRKIKLTPEQEQQQDALKEIEAILNMEITAEIEAPITTKNKEETLTERNKKVKIAIAKKAKKIQKILKLKEKKEQAIKNKEEQERLKRTKKIKIIKQSDCSPFLVDVPNLLKQREEENKKIFEENKEFTIKAKEKYEEFMATSKNSVVKVAKNSNKTFFGVLDGFKTKIENKQKKTANKLNKIQNIYQQKYSPQAFKEKIASKVGKTKKEVFKISQEFENNKKKKIPANLLFKSILTNVKIKKVTSLYWERVWHCHKNTISELAITSIFTVLGFISFRIYSALIKIFLPVYKFLYIIGVYSYRMHERTTKKLWHSKFINFILNFPEKIVDSMARIIQLIAENFINLPNILIKSLNKKISQTRHIAQSTAKKIKENTNNTKKVAQENIKLQTKSFKEKIIPKFVIKYLPPRLLSRRLAGFAVIAIMLILPFKAVHYYITAKYVQGEVLGASEEALASLKTATAQSGQLNFAYAANKFSSAADSFTKAQDTLSHYSELVNLAKILPSKKAKLAAQSQELLATAQSSAIIGEQMARAFSSLQIGITDTDPLTKRLDNFVNYSKNALSELDKLEINLNKIDSSNISTLAGDNSSALIGQFNLLKNNTDKFKNGLNEVIDLASAVKLFLGDEHDARYLVVFQNNSEMRPGGGFIGSFALVDFSQGEIKNIEAPGGGSYDLQGGLHTRVLSPEPLHLVSSLWEFHDANWWPDWPKSAEKLAWFFENGWGSSVDGVVGITTTFAERLLEITGPIDMTKNYGKIITSENFYDIVQTESEKKDTNAPKEIIGDMIDQILVDAPELIRPDNFFALFNLVENSLVEKHVLMNFQNEELQQFVKSHNWDGEIKKTAGDYLSVINTNIGGGKSDRKIRQSVDHRAEVMPDGSIINTVVVTREHTAVKNEPFSGIRNVNYLRLYVPKGSELLEADGFFAPEDIYFDEPATGAIIDEDIALTNSVTKVDEKSGTKIYNELDKTVFANWAMVDPGHTIKLRFKYKLPFKINSIKQTGGIFKSLFTADYTAEPYSLYFQKQHGMTNVNFYSELVLPPKMKVVWNNNKKIEIYDRGWTINENINKDGYWSVIVE